MATYLLTTGDDKITGTSGADTFDGWIDGKTGGIDTLDGGGGNDTFKLSGNGGGVIDGGAGTDILALGREGLGTQTFKNVEIVDVSKSYSFSGSVSQLNSFDQIVSKNSGGYIRVNVMSEGGSLDFSSKVSEGYSIRLHFDVQSPATSGISVIATANDDFLDGTDFDDVLSGGGGSDTIRSAEGSDVLNGGDGNDILTAGVGFGIDTLNGGEGDDLISNGGQSGGILYGDAGNDTFKIGGLINIIDGGTGIDTILTGDDYGFQFDHLIKNVEILSLTFNSFSFKIEDANQFQTITSEKLTDLYLNLIGNGGSVDFSTRITEGISAHIFAYDLSSGATIVGSNGDDSFVGSRFNDVLRGGAGNDSFEMGLGSDVFEGNEGNDYFHLGYIGDSIKIDGGSGIDTMAINDADMQEIVFSNVEILEFGFVYRPVVLTSKQISSITTLINSFDQDRTVGFQLKGSGSFIDFSALVIGDERASMSAAGATSGVSIVGTSKADYFGGSNFNDIFEGGDGIEIGFDGPGDYIDGGTGSDTATYARSKSGVTVNLATNANMGGEAEDDVLTSIENVTGSDFVDSLTGDDNSNRLSGGKGNDTLTGGAGADALIGGEGVDTATYADSATGIVASLANPAINTGHAAGDIYVAIENLTGSAYDDALNGNNSANTIIGNAGNDTIKGYDGDDKLSGGDGNDILSGGLGADYLSGGMGTDTASYAQATAAVKVNLADPSLNAGDAKGDTFNSIENLTGSAFNDTLDGNAGANTLTGLGGIDVLRGAAGNDTLVGGDGDDKLGGGDGNDLLSGGSAADYLNGGNGTDTASYAGAAVGVIVSLAIPAGNTGEAAGDSFLSVENLEGSGFSDRLTGNSAANAVSGLNGTDVIDGGAGSDVLTGGAGKDYFVFASALGATNVDTIADFSATDDTIRLDNAVFAALGATGALLSGYFRANATGTAQDSNDHVIYETDTGKLFYDADGNGAGAAIQFATLTGNPAISVADFQVI